MSTAFGCAGAHLLTCVSAINANTYSYFSDAQIEVARTIICTLDQNCTVNVSDSECKHNASQGYLIGLYFLVNAVAIRPAVYNTLSMGIAHACAVMISSYLATGVV